MKLRKLQVMHNGTTITDLSGLPHLTQFILRELDSEIPILPPKDDDGIQCWYDANNKPTMIAEVVDLRNKVYFYVSREERRYRVIDEESNVILLRNYHNAMPFKAIGQFIVGDEDQVDSILRSGERMPMGIKKSYITVRHAYSNERRGGLEFKGSPRSLGHCYDLFKRSHTQYTSSKELSWVWEATGRSVSKISAFLKKQIMIAEYYNEMYPTSRTINGYNKDFLDKNNYNVSDFGKKLEKQKDELQEKLYSLDEKIYAKSKNDPFIKEICKVWNLDDASNSFGAESHARSRLIALSTMDLTEERREFMNFVGEIAEGHGDINTCVYLHSPTNSGLIHKRADGVTTETHFHVLDEDLQYKANILNAMLSGSTLAKEGKTETMFIDDVGFAVRRKVSSDNCVKEHINIREETVKEFVSAEYETFYYLVQK